ncbi:hypothetical protein [Phaffia rhodozyma]|uniref:Uncharacterized protein n=1 Tax=Phaffia rhodozyma TaxID=264483 RepID=A0A0F7SWK4_PHARH|nr:hypothetical protein [Phaffia rhodozyma]
MDQQDSALPIPPSTPLPSVLAWVGSPNYELKEKILAAARREPKTFFTPSQEPAPTSPPSVPSGPHTRRPLRPIGSNSSKRPRHNDSLSSILTDSGSSVSSSTTLASAAGPPTSASSLAPGRQATRSPSPLLFPERVLSRSNSASDTQPDPTTPSLTIDQHHHHQQQQQQQQSEPWSLQKLLSEVDSRRTKQREQSARENANRTFNRVRSVDRSSSLSAGMTRSVERARTLGPETNRAGSNRFERDRGEGNKLPLSLHNRQNGAKQTNSVPSMSPRLDTLSSKSKSAPSFPYPHPYPQPSAQLQPAPADSREFHQRNTRAISPLRPLSQITVSPKPVATLGTDSGTTEGGSPLRSCLSPNRQGQKRKSSELTSPSKRPSFALTTELVAGPSRPPSAPAPVCLPQPQPRNQNRQQEKQPLFLPSSPPSPQPLPAQTHATTTTTTTRRMTRQATQNLLPIPTATTNESSKPLSYASPLTPMITTTTPTTVATPGATMMARPNEANSKAYLYPPPKVPIGSRRTTRQSHNQPHHHPEGNKEGSKPTVQAKEEDEDDGETSFDSFDGMFDALGDEGREELEAILRVVDGRG